MLPKQTRNLHHTEHPSFAVERSPSAGTAQLDPTMAADQQESWFETAIQHLGGATSIIDRNGTVRVLGAPDNCVLGHTAPEQIGDGGTAFVHPDDREYVQGIYRELSSRPMGGVVVEFRAPHADGTWRWISASATNLFDVPGIDGIVVNSRDITELKMAAQAQSTIASIVEASSEAIVGTNRDGSIATWNPGAERLYDYAAHEMIGHSVSKLAPADLAHEGNELVARVCAGEHIRDHITTRKRKDGTLRTISLNVSPVFDHLGAVVGTSSIARDVTELRAAELQLRENAETFESLLNATTEGIAVHENGVIVVVNKLFASLLGYGEAELIGRDILDFVSPSSIELVKQNMQNPGGREYELIARHRDGSDIPAEIRSHPIRFRGREMRLVSARNVSDRYSAQAALRASEERFRALVQRNTDIIAVVDGRGAIAYASPSMETILGYAVSELSEMPLIDLIHPDDHGHVVECWRRAMGDSNVSERFEYRVRHRDGPWVWLEATATGMIDDPVVGGVVLNARDITLRREIESELRFRTELLDQAWAAVIATTLDGTITHWNRYAEVLYGWNHSEAVGQNAESLLTDIVNRDMLTDRRQRLKSGERFEDELTLRRKDGTTIDVRVSESPVLDERGQIIGAVSVSVDIRERKELVAQLRHAALHDPLTGLPNRALFADRLQHALDQSGRNGTKIAVLFLDLDHFKSVNDSFGHSHGDTVLQLVADRFLMSLRAGDTLARIGGDEFVALLEGVDSDDDASMIADRLVESLELPFVIKEQDVRIGVSIGIAIGAAPSTDAEQLMNWADEALYRAKSSGRGGRAHVRHDPAHIASDLDSLGADLQWAVEHDELELEREPVLNLNSGAVEGFDARITWRHPTYGLLQPRDFVSAADELNVFGPAGAWAIRELTATLSKRGAESFAAVQLFTSYELPTSQFRDRRFVNGLAHELERCGADPTLLLAEIDGALLAEDANRTESVLLSLNALGVRIVIGAFGSHTPDLRSLLRLPVYAVKLHRMFCQETSARVAGRGVVEGITALAHAHNLRVFAQGIETEAQYNRIRAAGCDFGQGAYVNTIASCQSPRSGLPEDINAPRSTALSGDPSSLDIGLLTAEVHSR